MLLKSGINWRIVFEVFGPQEAKKGEKEGSQPRDPTHRASVPELCFGTLLSSLRNVQKVCLQGMEEETAHDQTSLLRCIQLDICSVKAPNLVKEG